ncbi:MAG: cysteine desulfurase family protein, partial [Candidatus Dormibacteraceae bacterium]
HAEGRAARAALDRARDRAAAATGADPGQVVFCSCGTEAINLALLGAGRRLGPGSRVVTWAAEHQAVLGAVRQLELEGHPVSILPVDGSACAIPDLIPDDARLISIGLANNEVGTLQPVAEVAARARQLGAAVHLDAAQGPRWCRPPVELVDLVSFSGHKLGAGRGGLLLAGRAVSMVPLQFGGPQEWNRRAGREDLHAATALAVALEVCAARREMESARAAPLAGRLAAAVAELGGRPTGAAARLPNLASACFPRVRGEDILLALDLAGVSVSSGSACASGSLDPSHVLIAAGLSLDQALGSLRLSTGYETTADEIDLALARLGTVLGPLAHAGRGAPARV